eukprot:g14235.t1
MSRKPAAGSLEAAALSLAQEVSGNPDDWERRRKALFSMQQAVDAAGRSLPEGGGGEKALFTPDVWRYLKEPLKHTLNDLRSAIVKEACVLLEKLSTVSGNYMAALMRDMLNVLLQLMANGNSVIVGQVDSCMRHIIAHSRFPRQLKEVEYTVRNSRSKDLRESVGAYVLLMLKTWPAASMDKEAVYLESIVQLLMKDASSAARTDARASFGILMEHWPKRANKVLQAAEPRTAKSLREQYGIAEAGITAAASSSSLSSLAATTAGGGGRGGGVPRGSKASSSGVGGAANAKGSRRGPTSAEASRDDEAAESAGNGQQSTNPPPSPFRQRRPKAATAARGGGAKRVPSVPASSSSAPSSSGGSGAHGGSSGSPSPAASASAPTASSLAGAAARKRRNGLVPGSIGTASSSPAAAAAAEAKSPSTAAAAAARRRRPLTTPTSTSSAAASAARSPTPKSGTTTAAGATNRSATKAKVKRLSSSSVASTASEAASGAGLSRPGTLVSSPLLVSPDGFLAAPAGKRRASGGGGGGGGGAQGGASSAAGLSVGLGEGAKTSLVEGDKVRFQADTQRTGVVRYVGETQFATGVWVGVELPPTANPPGLNDGSVNGVSYFTCPPACGVFAKPDMFDLIGEEEGVATAGDGATGSEEASADAKATLAGVELLRFHKMFANEELEALTDEMALLPGLESLVESKQPVLADRVRYYVEVLESAAEAREAAAARLRAQIRQTTERYPAVFSAASSSPSPASPFGGGGGAAAAPGEALDSLEGGGGGASDVAVVEAGGGAQGGADDDDDDEDEEEEREEGREAGGKADGHEKGGGGGGGEDGGNEDSGDGGDGHGDGDGGGGGGGNDSTGAAAGAAASGEIGDNGNAESTAAIAEDDNANTNTTNDDEAAAISKSQGEGQTKQRDGEEEGGLDKAESRAPSSVVDVDLANGKSRQEGRGGDKDNGNVFGMAGRFLRDVLRIPPGEDAAAAAAAGDGEAAAAASLPTLASVDIITSPTTPNAIAADSKSGVGGRNGSAGGLGEDGGDEEGVGAENVGVSVEGVVVET